MKKSIIDIGTNTVLLLIADYDPINNSMITIKDIQQIPRLGKGIDSNRIISKETISKACKIIEEYKSISSQNGVEKIIATATSFLRDSANKVEFIQKVFDNTGIHVELLSGEDEAKWTFVGGSYGTLKNDARKDITLIDIGGGSTEIISGHSTVKTVHELSSFNNINIKGQSLNIGSVRIKERYFKEQPYNNKDIERAAEFVLKELEESNLKLTGSKLIGVAGTITTLTAMKLKLNKFEAEKVDGNVLTFEDIDTKFNEIKIKSYNELLKMGDYMEGRSDIIIPGILILKTFMKQFGFSEITVSTKGLRYGIFIREVIHSSDESFNKNEYSI
jgi:exopolyphosphatase/guanosine-5'-triphosphate,3'-diphosphate pyrophosphatase